jgi:hypothetical protein
MRSSRLLLPAVSLIVAMIILSAPLSGERGPTSGAAIRTSSQPVTPPFEANKFANEINTTVTTIYGFLQGNTSATVSHFLPISTIDSRALSMLSVLANTSTFEHLYSIKAPGNFTIQTTFTAGQGIQSVSFTEGWTQGGTTYGEYWAGYISNLSIVGPITTTQPATYAAAFFDTTANWGGWDFWSPNMGTLHSNGADAIVPTVSIPSQTPSVVPSGATVAPVMTAWTSLMENNSGTQLLQTGYNGIPTTHGTTYPLWWEFYPYNSQQSYSGSPSVSPGNVVRELEFNIAGTDNYTVECYNYNSSTGYTASGSAAYYNPGWVPNQGAAIVEAYSSYETGYGCSSNYCIQQIAKFTNQEFEDGLLWEDGSLGAYTIYNYTNLYNGGHLGIYQLSQAQSGCPLFCTSIDNTNQNYQNAWSWDSAYYGYPQVSWDTSEYQWSDVN